LDAYAVPPTEYHYRAAPRRTLMLRWALGADIAASVIFLGPDATPYNSSQSAWALFALGVIQPAMLAGAAFLTVLLTALHYWRFRVPITIAAGCGALLLTIVGLASGIFPQLPRGAHSALILACGLAIFGLAMRFDMTDPERLTRRTDIAFWLHLLAAPLIVHSFIGGVLDVGSKLEPKPAVAVVAVFLALSFVAVLIDRRALLVSGLAYAGGAFWTLIRQAGLSDITTPLTILTLGAFVLLLSAGWKPLRAGIEIGTIGAHASPPATNPIRIRCANDQLFSP